MLARLAMLAMLARHAGAQCVMVAWLLLFSIKLQGDRWQRCVCFIVYFSDTKNTHNFTYSLETLPLCYFVASSLFRSCNRRFENYIRFVNTFPFIQFHPFTLFKIFVMLKKVSNGAFVCGGNIIK